MTPTSLPASQGSRTTALVVVGIVASCPAFVVFAACFGIEGGIAALVMSWLYLVLWLFKKRQDDPTWNHRPPTRRS